MAKYRNPQLGNSLGENICWFRKQRGLTQTALASKIGMPRENLSRIETGAWPNSRIGAFYRIAAVLGVPVRSLFIGLPVGYGAEER